MTTEVPVAAMTMVVTTVVTEATLLSAGFFSSGKACKTRGRARILNT